MRVAEGVYESYFGFQEQPFSISPDPRFLYLSERHRDALAHLVYGLNDRGGFVMLTGEVGTGKTTLCRSLLEQVPAHIDVAFVLNPRLDAIELLETIADELHIDRAGAQGSIKRLVDAINEHLLRSHAASRSTVLLIDEAQNLSTEVLEQLRLLTNLETNERKLLRIILIGQPELSDKLARADLRQLAQRITARYHLAPLTAVDTAAYVQHRLAIAGAKDSLFTPAAIRRLHRLAGGIPRIINVIADRALLGAYSKNVRRIGADIINQAARETRGPPSSHRQWLNKLPWRATAVTTVLALAVAAGWYWLQAKDPVAAHGQDAIAAASGASSTVNLSAAGQPQLASKVLLTPMAATRPAQANPNAIRIAPGPTAASIPSTSIPSTTRAADSKPAPTAIVDAALTIRPNTSGGATDLSATAGNKTSTPDAATVAAPNESATNATPSQSDNASIVWPADAARAKSLDLAFAAVFRRWDAPYARRPDENACSYARRVGLACLFGQGEWRTLLDMNRPAILKLYSADGTSFSVALLAVKGKLAQISIAAREQWLPAAQIDAAWQGQYTVLWQTPPGYREPLIEGASGGAVTALRSTLRTVTGSAPDPAAAPEVLDASLVNALKSYQVANGLEGDGHAGPRTWIALLDASGKSAPHLRANAQAGQ